MELGEKLRQARVEAGLSQRQLCGQQISRNMLSQIESGKARPSMDTLRYLAAQLGKSVSWFLEEESITSPNQQVMATAREAYRVGAYQSALEALSGYRMPDLTFDPERAFIEALCRLGLAAQALEQGKLPYARQLLEKAENCPSPYWTPPLEAERRLLLAQAGGDVSILPDERPLLLQARQALDAGNGPQAIKYLEAVQARDPSRQLLMGQALVLCGNFKGAALCLHDAEQAFPQETAPLLEQCYRELEDFKMAYHYACLQKE